MGWGVNDYPGPPPEKPVPVCPVCGMECDTFYLDSNQNRVGCENCRPDDGGFFYVVDAYEWEGEK